MTRKTDVLILGGGLAGLSTAYHLRPSRRSCMILERRARPGGLAGSVEQDGFVFDHTGHLLHLHDDYGRALIGNLLKGNLLSHKRNASIHMKGVFTRYPFQANTFGLPRSVIEDCVAGFLKTVLRPKPVTPGLSYKEWCLRVFGEGISRHFMFPYNEKLWRRPLSRMTTEWQGRFVPKPLPEEVLYGALTDQKKFFGYNASFLYPSRGGIQALPDALSARVEGLRLSTRVTAIHWREKIAEVEGLGEVRYEHLVNTAPLAEFLDLARPLPSRIRAARAKLQWVSVYNLNIGIDRPRISDKHWIYFPEDKFPFYRAGFSSNFSEKLGPRGTSSMYIEVSARPHEAVDLDRLERKILNSLKSCGILRSSDRILTRVWLPIPCAYVVYDFNRASAVKTALDFLHSHDIESIGRYGAWKYSFMEETILDGKSCAERLMGISSAPAKARAKTSDGPDVSHLSLKLS